MDAGIVLRPLDAELQLQGEVGFERAGRPVKEPKVVSGLRDDAAIDQCEGSAAGSAPVIEALFGAVKQEFPLWIADDRREWNQMFGGSARQCDAREHRVRRAHRG